MEIKRRGGLKPAVIIKGGELNFKYFISYCNPDAVSVSHKTNTLMGLSLRPGHMWGRLLRAECLRRVQMSGV